MNVLFEGPLGALLAKPWVDHAGLFGLKRWYMPLSRLWAAANAAGEDAASFRDQAGMLPAFWSGLRLRSLLGHHTRLRQAAEAARTAWEDAIFDNAAASNAEVFDRKRRAAATRHLMTRAAFYPLLFPRRPAAALWQIDPPGGDFVLDYGAPLDPATLEVSRPCVRDGRREYWLRAPTPSPALHRRPGSETMYARVVEPADREDRETLILGSGLCLEFELLSVARDPGARLAADSDEADHRFRTKAAIDSD